MMWVFEIVLFFAAFFASELNQWSVENQNCGWWQVDVRVLLSTLIFTATHLSVPIYRLQQWPLWEGVRSINLNEMRAFIPSPITNTHTRTYITLCIEIHTHTSALTVSHPPFPLSSPVCGGKHMHLNQLWGAVVTKTNDVVCNIFLLT